jgi:hemerythrin-like domain-containing protein
VNETLIAALEREHRETDRDIEAFVDGLMAGAGDAKELMRAMDLLRRHIYFEEELLFPLLRLTGMIAPLFVMLREHGELWRSMDSLEKLLADDAGADALSGACQQLLALLASHNSKEEPIVYPHAGATLGAAADDALRAFVTDGHMPYGWVCLQARA